MSMVTYLFIGAVVVLVLTIAIWAVRRTSHIRAEARAREMAAIALVAAGRDPAEADTDAAMDDVGSRLPSHAGIEVSEVVDLDELLAGASAPVASRARAQLEQPTDLLTEDLRSLPLLPAAAKPVESVAAWAAAPVRMPAEALAFADGPGSAMATTTLGGNVPPCRPAPTSFRSKHAMSSSPTPPSAAGTLPAGPRTWSPTENGIAAGCERDDVALRELVLAWFEARGYRSSPASMAVRPIELVLRHKNDPARAYAFVVEADHVSRNRVKQLREQARSIGLMRLLVVASAGADPGAADQVKGVRLMDASAIDTELDKLDFSIAAKIIAVARKRSQLASVH
jgi:hypothetical protein